MTWNEKNTAILYGLFFKAMGTSMYISKRLRNNFLFVGSSFFSCFFSSLF